MRVRAVRVGASRDLFFFPSPRSSQCTIIFIDFKLKTDGVSALSEKTRGKIK